MNEEKEKESLSNVVAIGEVVRKAKEACELNYSEADLHALRAADLMDSRIDRLKSSGVASVIPSEMLECIACDSVLKTGNVNTAISWICNAKCFQKPFLFLLGSVGRGKTIAAATLLAERSGFYIRAQEAEILFEQKYGAFIEQQLALLERRLLVIDDIGTERNADSFTVTLQRIVDSRQGRRFRTVFTSNLKKVQIYDRYQDARLISRLNQLALFVNDFGLDMRAGKV